MTIAHDVVRQIAAAGPTHLFGLMGVANMRLVSEWIGAGDRRYVAAASEHGAVLMAEGHARASGTLGLATVTHGPGVTNTTTAMIEAARNRTPLVLVTGSTSAHVRHFQQYDLSTWAHAAESVYVRVRSTTTVADDVRQAVRSALQRQTAVVLDLPIDLVDAEVTAADSLLRERLGPAMTLWLNESPAVIASSAGSAASEPMDAAAGALASARAPFVLAGYGAVKSGAGAELRALAEQLGAHAGTTLRAKGLFRGYTGDVGVIGTLASDRALEAVGAADCIIAFGASLNPFTTVGNDLLRGRHVIQCDADPLAFGASVEPDLTLLGDVAEVAAGLGTMIRLAADGAPLRPVPPLEPVPGVIPPADESPIDPVAAFRELNAALPAGRTVVLDSGFAAMTGWRWWDAAAPRRFMPTSAFGAIGLSLATAIGAAFADRGELTTVVLGDGAWAMSLGELVVAVEHRLPLLVIVCNDGGYGTELMKLEAMGLEPALAELRWPSPAAAATALGAQGVRTTTMGELREVVQALTVDQPTVLELVVSPMFTRRAGGI